ncbi:DNA-binding protein [Chitinimonas sp. PSY-7]|uniref:DNA-binding protein n=1 Tax=Chitinimonas sp. PSY-7 TaxID=3459088 RepID=UPI00403FFC97
MARSGVSKADIENARDRLAAQGRNPSIDAVRAELGNTGSKTTIQRYLRELAQEEGDRPNRDAGISEAIQSLASRLAEQLKDEADRQVVELREQYEAELQAKEVRLMQLRTEVEVLNSRTQQAETALQSEKEENMRLSGVLAEEKTANMQLSQKVAGLNERLKDNEAHRQSLEEKHTHARDALEHYRQSVKEQREQEQRRHEHQLQQLQMEARTLNQTLVVKQNELTQLYQTLAKETAELAAVRKDLGRVESEVERIEQTHSIQLQQNTLEAEKIQAEWAERLNQKEGEKAALADTTQAYLTQLREQELVLIELRTRLASQDEMLVMLKEMRQFVEARVTQEDSA